VRAGDAISEATGSSIVVGFVANAVGFGSGRSAQPPRSARESHEMIEWVAVG